jgi:hypothetical protein
MGALLLGSEKDEQEQISRFSCRRVYCKMWNFFATSRIWVTDFHYVRPLAIALRRSSHEPRCDATMSLFLDALSDAVAPMTATLTSKAHAFDAVRGTISKGFIDLLVVITVDVAFRLGLRA